MNKSNQSFSLKEVYASSISSAPKESIKRSFKKDMEHLMTDLFNEIDAYPNVERIWMMEAFCEFMDAKMHEVSLINKGGASNDH